MVLRTAPLVTQIAIIQEVLSDINIRKGESECQYYIDKLEYLYDRQRHPLIHSCKSLLCHGELRNKSGSVRTCTDPRQHPHREACVDVVLDDSVSPSCCSEAARVPLL